MYLCLVFLHLLLKRGVIASSRLRAVSVIKAKLRRVYALHLVILQVDIDIAVAVETSFLRGGTISSDTVTGEDDS